MYRCVASIIKCIKYVIAWSWWRFTSREFIEQRRHRARGLSKEHNTLVYKTRVKIKRQAVSRIHPRHDKFPSLYEKKERNFTVTRLSVKNDDKKLHP